MHVCGLFFCILSWFIVFCILEINESNNILIVIHIIIFKFAPAKQKMMKTIIIGVREI